MPLRVVVLFHRSLFADGIASRLREHADLVEALTVDAGLPDAADQLRAAGPAIVVFDATDAGALEKMPVSRLLDLLPNARVLRIDPDSDHVRVFSSVARRAKSIGELIAVMQAIPVG